MRAFSPGCVVWRFAWWAAVGAAASSLAVQTRAWTLSTDAPVATLFWASISAAKFGLLT